MKNNLHNIERWVPGLVGLDMIIRAVLRGSTWVRTPWLQLPLVTVLHIKC